MITIVLAEDHTIVRNAIKTILDQEQDIEVVFEAENGRQVLNWLTAGNRADVILSDMNMPEMNGIDMLKVVPQDIKVIIFTMLEHKNYVSQAINAGARGYLLKNVSKNELLFAIRFVYGGGSYICAELSFQFFIIVDDIYNQAETNEIKSKEFSEREMEILMLMGDGYTNMEIAEKLFTSTRTVEGHRQNLILKTGVKNTSALIKFAVINGLIK